MTISENGVSFFGAGGHNHNGVNSTLIDTSSYSIFDFNTGYTGSQTRINRQSQNKSTLEDWIIRVINSRVLEPAGISLDPDTLNGKAIRANTITATQIAANTITANEIAANTITATQIAVGTITGTQIAPGSIGNTEVGNVMSIIDLQSDFVTTNAVIRSTVYTPGSAGWQISANGNAEFSGVTVRGTVVASGGSIGGWSINPSYISGGATYLYSNGRITNGNFNVSSTGVLTATGANINGTITASDGFIGNYSISGGSLSCSSSGTIVDDSWSSTITLDTASRISTSSFYTAPLNGLGFHNVITFNIVDNYAGGIKVERATYNQYYTQPPISYAGYNYTAIGPVNISDSRLKDIINKEIDALDIINMLKIRTYTFKRDSVKKEKYGFVAQELYEVLPESVIIGGDDPAANPWMIALESLIPYLTKSIQELSKEVDDTKSRLQALEGV